MFTFDFIVNFILLHFPGFVPIQQKLRSDCVLYSHAVFKAEQQTFLMFISNLFYLNLEQYEQATTVLKYVPMKGLCFLVLLIEVAWCQVNLIIDTDMAQDVMMWGQCAWHMPWQTEAKSTSWP